MSDINSALDERLEAAIQAANYQTSLRAQREQLKQKLKQKLTFSYNGGTFYVSKELVSFVQTLLSLGHMDTILIDINENPIEVMDLEAYLEIIVDRYQEAHNEYMVAYSHIRRSRNVKALVGA